MIFLVFAVIRRELLIEKKTSTENMKYPYNSETEGNEVWKGFIVPFLKVLFIRCYLLYIPKLWDIYGETHAFTM